MDPVSLSPGDVKILRGIVDEACSDTKKGLPCANVALLGDGVRWAHELLNYQLSPTADSGSSKDADDIYWLASCTKLVTAIACMQLVEKDVIGLDDAAHLAKWCPELQDVKVWERTGALVDKKKGITLRMLLTHTAGFGYSFLSPALRSFRQDQTPHLEPFDEFSGNAIDFDQPLVNQPGKVFEYGISMDWAGVFVERASGLKLNDYMSRHIFEPLGIRDLSMTPSEDMVNRLTGLWQRSENGELLPRQHPLQKPLNPIERRDSIHSGGAGLFGSIREFSKILQVLLRGGRGPNGVTILSADSVEELFTNQFVSSPDFARQPLTTTKPDLANPADQGLYPLCPSNKAQGWGLGGLITPSITGRSDTTMQWSGLSNIFWWCDRENGIAGVVGSQILPFADSKVIELWLQLEQTLYKMVEKGKSVDL